MSEHHLDGLPIGHLISLLADVREDRAIKDADRAALETWRAEYQARHRKSTVTDEVVLLKDGPDYTCVACASRGPFVTVRHDIPGEPVDYNMQCACGSTDIRDTPQEAFEAHAEKSNLLACQVSDGDAFIQKLLAAIRKHRDQKGDDRCWLDDRELYQVLPEGLADADLRLPPPEVMRANCHRYIAHRHEPNTPYVSPQREVERAQQSAESRVAAVIACAEDWAAEGLTLAAWAEHAKARHLGHAVCRPPNPEKPA